MVKKVNLLFATALLLGINAMAITVKFEKKLVGSKLDGVSMGLAAGDVDNDGKVDIAVSTWPDGMKIFFQKDGVFPEKPGWSFNKEKILAGIIIKDLNDDKINDLAVNSFVKRTVLFFDGKKGLKEPREIFNNNVSRSDRGLKAAKVTINGIFSFITGPVLRTQLKDGIFKRYYVFGPEKQNDNSMPVYGDLNHDGTLDLVFAARKANSIRVYGGPVPATGYKYKPSDAAFFYELLVGETINSVALVDVNADERIDIVYTTSKGTFVFIQNKPEGFVKDQKPEPLFDGFNGRCSTGDIDNDKMDDLILRLKDRIYIFSGAKRIKGKALSEANVQLDLSRYTAVGPVAIVDVNGDGLNDVVTAENAKRKIQTVIFLQQKQ